MSETKKVPSQLEEKRQEERIQLAQKLLNRPWVLKSEDAELFTKCKEHYEPLRSWFQQFCGFTLLLTRELIKLEKVPGKAQPWMGFQEFSSVLDYALFTYCLWYLEGKAETEQFALSELVEEVKSGLLRAGSEFDESHYPHRLSLKRALKKLRGLGALRAVDGDEEEWVHHYQDERKNVLYETTPVTRYVLRRFSQDISQVTSKSQLGEGVYPDNQEGENARRRHHIFRRYVQEPAVLDHEWQPEDLAYVLMQRSYILSQMETALGLVGSRYKEGLLFFYTQPKGDMELFPTAQSISDLVLLLAAEIRNEHLESGEEVVLTRPDLEMLVSRMKQKQEKYWSKKDREAKISELTEELLLHMEEWGLAKRLDEQHVQVLAVLGRWTGFYKTQEEEDES